MSYGPPSKECKELMMALPRGVVDSVVKVQACFRGYLFRARYFSRARFVANYCKASDWPRLRPRMPEDEVESPKDKERRQRKKAKRLDPGSLDAKIADFQPNVSKYHGGDSVPTAKDTWQQRSMGGTARTTSPMRGAMASTLGSTGQSMMRGQPEIEPDVMPAPLHIRVSADLFALYAYNMYRCRELVRMWMTLCEAYERGMDVFAELLERNPALKPMLESISAQLKRGAVVGYDKAFIAKQQKGAAAQTPVRKGADADMFKRQKAKGANRESGLESTMAASETRPLDATAGPTSAAATSGQPFGGAAAGSGGTTMLPPSMASAPPLGATSGGQGGESAMEVTGEYL